MVSSDNSDHGVYITHQDNQKVIAIALNCPSEFEVKTLQVHTPHISETGLRRIELELIWKFPPQGGSSSCSI